MPEESIVLDTAGLYLALRKFEETHQRATGEYLPSAVVYQRYRAGELDDVFTSLWMSFFEAFERRAAAEGVDPAEVLERALEPLVPA